MLNRETILNANDCPLIPVDAPEWGGQVFVPVLSISDLESITATVKADGNDKGNAALAVQVIRDADGNRIFGDADAPLLAKKSSKVILRVIGAFNDANGFTEQKVEQAAKN